MAWLTGKRSAQGVANAVKERRARFSIWGRSRSLTGSQRLEGRCF